MITNLDLRIRAVSEVNDYALEFNLAALDAQLNCTESSSCIHTNAVMIPHPVDSRLSKIFPSFWTVKAPLGVGIQDEPAYHY
jgi:hypothetical protein